MSADRSHGFELTIRLGFAPSQIFLSMRRGWAVSHMTNYEAGRAAQVIAYFALRAKGRSLNILKAMKLVYLGDRESLRRHGEPILVEPRTAMKRGPVNRLTYTNASRVTDLPAEWSRYLHPRNEAHEIAVRGDIGFRSLDALSEDDVECLDAVWRDFGWMNEHVLCAWTHDPANIPEWTDPQGGRVTITLAQMMEALGLPDARARAQEIEGRTSLRQLVEAIR